MSPNIDELKSQWKVQDEKLERNLKLNVEILKRMNLDKVRSAFQKFNRAPISGIILGMIVQVYSALFIYNNIGDFALVSMAGILFLSSMMQNIFSIYQLTTIVGIKLEESVVENQRTLAKLERNRHRYLIITRFFYAVLWLPVTIVLSKMIFDVNLFRFLDTTWLIVNSIIIVFFGCFGIWLSLKFSKNEIENKWLLKLVESIAKSDLIGQRLRDSMALLSEIETFEKNV